MQIDEYAPQIISVDALTSGDVGLGSRRRNQLVNGASLVEEITDWRPGKAYAVKLYDMATMPLHKAASDVRITAVGARSRVTWTFDYRVKYGPFGWLLGQSVMSKILDGNLKGLADTVAFHQNAEKTVGQFTHGSDAAADTHT